MGLNMNRSLLLENSNLQFKIPSYSKCYNTPVFTEGYMLTKISKYNTSVLEAMDNIDMISVSGSSNESAVNAVNELAENLDTVINNTRDIKNLLIEMKDQAVESILKEDPNDKYLEGFNSYEMDKILDECSRNKSKALRISNITNLNEELLGNYPKIDNAVSTLSTIMNESITKVLPKMDFYNKNLNNEEGFSEGLNSLSDNLLDNVLTEVFGKYSYDKSGLMGSVIETSTDAFGYNSRKDRLFSTALYNAACRNLNARQEAADSLNKYMDGVSKSLNEMIVDMSSMRKAIIESEKKIPNDYSKSVNENVVGFIVGLKNKVGDIINGVKNTVDPTAKLAVNKIGRVNQVYNPDPAYGDSAKLKQLAAMLINQTMANIAAQHQANMNKSLFLKTTDESAGNKIPVSGLQAAQECLDMIDELEGMFAVYNEMAAEAERAEMIALREADGDQPNAVNAQPNISRSSQISLDNIKTNIQNWADLIAKQLERFKTRILDVVSLVINSRWWKENKKNFEGMTKEGFGETTVNQWFSYVLPNFEIELFKKFDINSEIYESDNTLQNSILALFDNKHKTALDENGDFISNLKKCYYNEYLNKDTGILARNIADLDPKTGFDFVNDISTRNTNGKYLGSVEKDWKDLNAEKDSIKSSMETYINTYIGANGPTNAVNNATRTESAKSTVDDGFERFSIAECFALSNNGGLLSLHEDTPATNNPDTNNNAQGGGNTATQTATANPADKSPNATATPKVNNDPNSQNSQNTIKSEGGDSKKIANDRINRYIKITGKAITVKATMIFAAYRAYIELFKATCGATNEPSEIENSKRK